MSDTHLDGNSVGGLLLEVFGKEMTAAQGRCGACGAVNVFAALVVYRDAPGDVLRCPSCDSVVLVMVTLPGRVRVSLGSLSWMEIRES